jgi:hypothetical protein
VIGHAIATMMKNGRRWLPEITQMHAAAHA